MKVRCHIAPDVSLPLHGAFWKNDSYLAKQRLEHSLQFLLRSTNHAHFWAIGESHHCPWFFLLSVWSGGFWSNMADWRVAVGVACGQKSSYGVCHHHLVLNCKHFPKCCHGFVILAWFLTNDTLPNILANIFLQLCLDVLNSSVPQDIP